ADCGIIIWQQNRSYATSLKKKKTKAAAIINITADSNETVIVITGLMAWLQAGCRESARGACHDVCNNSRA
ncbi:MAG TPA: hypothetical protein PL180_20770, partial [Spirochaetota bacterium]|nr:hypothetical protein [Spirochaetota bacterium]HRT77603.1 hypothetical protein [Spirochaetota bacterium]